MTIESLLKNEDYYVQVSYSNENIAYVSGSQAFILGWGLNFWVVTIMKINWWAISWLPESFSDQNLKLCIKKLILPSKIWN